MSSSAKTMQKLQNIRRVAIIGGGPAGVATAKYLLATKAFTAIDIFEQRSTCAGVWNYMSENDQEKHFSVPQTRPYTVPEQPIWRCGDEKDAVGKPCRKHATFISPLYERLEANLPKMIMQHSDFPFPNNAQLFPTHEDITEHLERYSDDVRNLIHFETQTLNVKPLSPAGNMGWSVTTKSLKSGNLNSANYDAVAVASGHFNEPFIPAIAGISEWYEQYPESITHSKYFRRPEDYKDKTVLTIGVGPSGSDIAAQIELYCNQPILVSSRSNTSPSPRNSKTRRNLPGIAEFIPETRSIRFTDGQIIPSIDIIMFCTGYLYSYPFLPALPLPSAPILTDGSRTLNLYQHIFYNADPTLAFLTLPQRIVPFPVSEAQSAVIAGVWAGQASLPDRSSMEKWERDLVEERGNGKEFHYLPVPEDGLYINKLHDWAMSGNEPHPSSSQPNGHVNGAHPEHSLQQQQDGAVHTKAVGRKEPPYWGEKEFWIRARVGEIKKAWSDLGEERHRVRTLEEVGFDYEEWKREGKGMGGQVDGEDGVETGG